MSIESGFLLTFAVEETLKKVGSTVIDDISHIFGMKKDLEKLRTTSWSIQEMLQVAEDKQITHGRVKSWLLKLQDLVYDADDVLDEFSYENLRRKIEIGDQLMRKICSYLLCSYNPVSFRLQIVNKVKGINKTFADFEKQAIFELALKSAVGAHRGAAAVNRDQMGTHSLLDESKPPLGRTKDLEKINFFLKAQSSSHNLKFVCIAGFGGLGKTTLAKMVYAEAKRNNLFDVTTWIDVSKTSNAIMILGEMLQKLDPSSGVSNNADTILEDLQKKLEEKTFLLVLDNVWNEKDTDWLNLEESLSLISKRDGNSVIITTRITELASVMSTGCRLLVKLQELRDEECWSIIKGKVFGRGELEDENLRIIGVGIAENCKGVPLVANVVGGMLRSKKDTSYWMSLKESNVWQDVKKNNILPVLRLNFDNLSAPLKQCFAYCSLFSKNFVFDKVQLIQMWMAEGFLYQVSENASTSESSMEDIGDKYFEELWANSFFQNVEVDKWGNMLRCKMHDFMHDLAMSVSNHYHRRMSFFADESCSRYELRKLRSLHSNKVVPFTLSNFKSLRSLNLYGADYKELPTSIGELKHLRYLDISNNFSIQELPKSITKLYNLQTLRVIDCHNLKGLPSKIGILVSLRHIHFNFLKLVPLKVGSLTNLRTLPLFVVRQEVGYEIQELKHLNELRGELEIWGLQNVRNDNEALGANLMGKKLSKLMLRWEGNAERDDEIEGSLRHSDCNYEEVLEGLVPPESIMSLTIAGYMGKLFPKWMSNNGGSESSLNQLAKLKLLGCKKCEIMPTLGHLPRLKILEIEGMENVRRIGSEFYGRSEGNVKFFPVLEKLKLRKMKSLEVWEAPNDINHAIPSLQMLSIHQCSLLKSIPLNHLLFLKRMQIEDCPKLVSLPIVSMSLESLRIYRCEELKLISISQELESLKCMSIIHCPMLTSIPDGWFPSIQELRLGQHEELVFDSSLENLASQKILEIYSCPKLASLPQGLKSLKHLTISDFSNLSADAFRGLSSLGYLHIQRIGNLELMPSVEDLISLEALIIEYCGNLTSLPMGLHLLKCLQELQIRGCDKIAALSPDIKYCTSLKHLSIAYCKGLISVETDIISSLIQLTTLELGPFSDELVEFPGFDESRAGNNPSFKEMILIGSGQIKSLPYLGHLTALKDLYIYDFGISELPFWLDKLSSLEYICIGDCKSLTSLPQSMRQLSKLKKLKIYECPLLARQYKENRSAVWPNISHIAYITMDGKVLTS